MHEPVSLTLHDRSRLVFTWTATGNLSVDLWRPGSNDALMLQGAVILSSAEASTLLQRIAERQAIVNSNQKTMGDTP